MKQLLFIALIISMTSVIYARQSKVLTLDQSVQLALEKNVNVIQSQNNIESAQGSVLAAYGNYLPTLTASGGWNRTQVDRAASSQQVISGQVFAAQSSFSVTNNFQSRFDLNYLLFDGFGRESNFKSATASASSAEYTATRTRQSITYQVESVYLNVLRDEQLGKVSDENLKRDRRQLERITESNRVGALALADVYRQQSQVAADELNLINAQNNYDKAKADLVALIGLDMMQEYQFTDSTVKTAIDRSELDSTEAKYKSLEGLIQRALTARPDYLAAKESFNAADASVSAARSGYYPTVSASAGYGFSNDRFSNITDNKSITWGISIRWNLFDAFRTNQSIQSATVAKNNAGASLTQAQRNIAVDVKKALLDFESAGKQVDVSQKGLLSATEDRKIAEERYNLGAGTLLDLLTANAGLVNAEVNNIDAVYSYILAKKNLEYVTGERTY